MKPSAARTALLLPAIAVAAVVGLALPGSVAMAQTGPGAKSGKTENKAAASKPGSVGGVTVQAPRRSALQKIPPDKAAGFDQEAADAEASEARRSQLRTVDRSERIRTYNFPENRISDHRVGFKAYNLDQVLDGDLDAVVQALADADTAAALGGEE